MFLASIKIYSQQDPNLSFFFNQMNFFNPAYAGSNFSNEISLVSRNQWAAIENSPTSQFLTISSSRKNNVGLGLSIYSNKNFVESRTISYIDFSYKLEFSSDKHLFLGIKGGSDFSKADLSDIANQEVFDPALDNSVRFFPNLGVGLLLKLPRFYFSFSIPRMFSNQNKDLVFYGSKVNPVFIGTGYKLSVTKSLNLKTNILLKSSRESKSLLMTNISLDFSENFELGFNYSTSNTISPLVSLNLKQFTLGYSYEMSLQNNLNSLGLKTHEVLIKYNMSKAQKEVVEEE